MDRRPFCSEVHKRGEMGNKRLGGLLRWQAIHSGSVRRDRKEGLRSEDGKMSVARWEMICRRCTVVLYVRYCTITSCLSGGRIRGSRCSPVAENLSADSL